MGPSQPILRCKLLSRDYAPLLPSRESRDTHAAFRSASMARRVHCGPSYVETKYNTENKKKHKGRQFMNPSAWVSSESNKALPMGKEYAHFDKWARPLQPFSLRNTSQRLLYTWTGYSLHQSSLSPVRRQKYQRSWNIWTRAARGDDWNDTMQTLSAYLEASLSSLSIPIKRHPIDITKAFCGCCCFVIVFFFLRSQIQL